MMSDKVGVHKCENESHHDFLNLRLKGIRCEQDSN